MRAPLSFGTIVGGGSFGHIGRRARRTPSPWGNRGTGQTYTAELADTPPAVLKDLLEAPLGSAQETAWEEFLMQYSRLLLRVSFAFESSYDRAMDRYTFILDELRRDNCRRLRRFTADGRGRFSTWLMAVASRLCLDHHRRCYGRWVERSQPPRGSAKLLRRNLVDLMNAPDDISSLPDTGVRSPEDELAAAERLAAIGGALDGLPPCDLLLLKLRFEDGLCGREIAEALGLPTPFHVYRRLRTVCARLRERLRRAGIDSSLPG